MKSVLAVLLGAVCLATGVCVAGTPVAPRRAVAPASAPRFQKITIIAVEGKISPDVVRVRRGDLVRLTFLPKDGTYGVSVPVLKLKGKATPERPVTFEFAASSEGEYEMRCTKFWGFKHWTENGKIVVE
ncbi:MAG TPA: cupredoxin domain-containing protein [Candidatus Polarisedimenticolia bacterium]|nr:cupredoxin domain-containing protein [Candidatus Polarisedimenticolia bacterium]